MHELPCHSHAYPVDQEDDDICKFDGAEDLLMVLMDLLDNYCWGSSIIQLTNTPFDESNGIESKCYGEEQDYLF